MRISYTFDKHKFYNVNSPVEQNLVRVLVELRIILDHAINGITLQGTAQQRW